MERELSMALKIMIELTFLAVLVSIVIAFAHLSNMGMSGLESSKYASRYLTARDELYEYNHAVVSGADVIQCISDNIGAYHIIVYDGPVNDPNSSLIIDIPMSAPGIAGFNYEKLNKIITNQTMSYTSTLIALDENEDGTFTVVNTDGLTREISGVLFEQVGG